ncbi:MAG: hypothetical protein KatS3mg045_0949 [Bellilinea sp.]|nr:MAG: hypothetical protein KatS3mg045_0949 [Bellilinea sp.]
MALVALLVLISDLPQAKWRIPVACAATVLGLSIAESPGVVYTMLVVFAVWALWEIGASGGADAKIIIALVLFFADGLLFIPIVLVGGVQGLVGLIARRKTIPLYGRDCSGYCRLALDGQFSRITNFSRKEVNKSCVSYEIVQPSKHRKWQ